MSEPKIVYRFTGDGTGRLPGVPMRNLTEADVAVLRPELLREVQASALYDPAKPVAAPTNVAKKDGD